MTRALWDQALKAAREAHSGALSAFCPFPEDLTATDVSPHRVPAARLFETDAAVDTSHPLAAAYHAASPAAQWRETWKGSRISQSFLDRFGCYCLIGSGGAFKSAQMSAYVVYMPAGLAYPWHQHPAAEVYHVLAGEAVFQRAGHPPERLGPGDTILHESNQPHATETHTAPLLAHVLWRGDLGTRPIWTDEALR